jgi:hypothetical protein
MFRREITQAIAKAAQRIDAAPACRLIQVFILRKPGGQTHGFAQRIDLEYLGTTRGFVDAADHQPEAVGAHVDSSQQTGGGTHE